MLWLLLLLLLLQTSFRIGCLWHFHYNARVPRKIQIGGWFCLFAPYLTVSVFRSRSQNSICRTAPLLYSHPACMRSRVFMSVCRIENYREKPIRAYMKPQHWHHHSMLSTSNSTLYRIVLFLPHFFSFFFFFLQSRHRSPLPVTTNYMTNQNRPVFHAIGFKFYAMLMMIMTMTMMMVMMMSVFVKIWRRKKSLAWKSPNNIHRFQPLLTMLCQWYDSK